MKSNFKVGDKIRTRGCALNNEGINIYLVTAVHNTTRFGQPAQKLTVTITNEATGIVFPASEVWGSILSQLQIKA